MLKWASELLSNTSDTEREKMQDVFDTAYWTMTANRKLQAGVEIVLMAVTPKPSNMLRHAFAYCENGKWTAAFR